MSGTFCAERSWNIRLKLFLQAKAAAKPVAVPAKERKDKPKDQEMSMEEALAEHRRILEEQREIEREAKQRTKLENENRLKDVRMVRGLATDDETNSGGLSTSSSSSSVPRSSTKIKVPSNLSSEDIQAILRQLLPGEVDDDEEADTQEPANSKKRGRPPKQAAETLGDVVQVDDNASRKKMKATLVATGDSAGMFRGIFDRIFYTCEFYIRIRIFFANVYF